MALKNEIVVLVFLISELVNVSLGGDLFIAPQIVSKGKEEILEANGNFSVFCQGNRPLKWTTPEIKDESIGAESWTTFQLLEEKPANPNYFKYGLRLYIYNMSYPYVGFYNCHFEDAEDISKENDENQRIYLFVDDKKHLSVQTLNVDNIFVRQGDTVVIPCLPTSPDVEVRLTLMEGETGEVPLNVLREDGTYYRYHPFYGIFTNDTANERGVLFRCDFERDEIEQQTMVYLEVEKKTTYIPAPSISDANRGHTVEGDTIRLNCSISYKNTNVVFSWTTPTGPCDPKRMSTTKTERDSILTIPNATMADSGMYICQVADFQDHTDSINITFKIFGKTEHDIFMRERGDITYTVAEARGNPVKWVVDVWGHPQSKFTWLNNSNVTIPESKGIKYEVTYTQPTYYSPGRKEVITLLIKNIDIKDFGTYTLVGENSYETKTLNFFLNVTDKPSVDVITEPFHLIGEEGKIQCTAAGNPVPEIQWEYKSCLRPECNFTLLTDETTVSEGLITTSEIKIKATESGLVKCIGINTIDSDTAVTGYFVTDIPDGFGITGFADTVIVDDSTQRATFAVGEDILVLCSAASSNYSQVAWLLNGEFIQNNERIKIHYNTSEYSKNAILQIKESDYSDSGEYSCRAVTHSGKEQIKTMSFLVQDPVKAQIVETNMNNEIIEDFPLPVTMTCMVAGLPKPKILWYKDSVIFNPSESRITFESSRQILKFNETKASDAGKYKCEAFYKDAIDFREVKLTFKNAPGTNHWLIFLVAFLLLMLFILMVMMIMKIRKERMLKREMQILGLANFEKGAIENINPELGIDDQAELLPYDRKWEFPIEQLKLGKQLGSGAFGVVLKGEAKHIVEGEPVTTVAVKMVKKNADNTYIKALASELKIMVHLGKHLNVVNLLGACTKNVAKRELLVIVEYCRFGNLQNYLLRHREHFIDQIDSQTGKVNYLIGQELLDRTYSISSNRSNIHSPLMKYATLAFSDSANNSVGPPLNSMGDYRAHATSEATDMTTVTQGEDSIMLSNNSVQPEWRSNYKGDYKENVKPICTKDLIAYAFQVTRGMEYLSSRKVLHGDLAARNILLADDNIVKICDFGLAKSMYKNDNYKKKGDCPLPVKWMAIESIRDRVFSTQSDVWSFGIVLWELFSLGRTPYPGMEADERLYHKLVEGYRLENPDYSPKEIYQIMTDCWSVKPTSRPSFTKLTERIGTLLEDTLRRHYIDLNDPYLAMNTKMLEGQNDYLSMLSPPTFEAVASPHYVNDIMTQQPPPEDGYMSMKPNIIFSPRVIDDEVFDFPTANRKNLALEPGKGHELLPMLRVISEADTESPLNSPTSICNPTSVSNPTYHLPPTILNDANDGQTEIVKSADNYVNMPQNKSLIKDKSVHDSKPTLNVDDKKVDQHHYVNEINQDRNNITVSSF